MNEQTNDYLEVQVEMSILEVDNPTATVLIYLYVTISARGQITGSLLPSELCLRGQEF